MMSIKKFSVIPLMIALLAVTLQIFDQLMHASFAPEGNMGFAWISFQAWAVYFVAGCTVKGGIKSFLGYLVGIVVSYCIIAGAGVISSLGFFAVPAAIFVMVVPTIFLERVPLLDFIPAVFIGAGAYFGFMTYVPGATFVGAGVTELAYCAIGLLYGFATVSLRSYYENKVLAKSPAKDAKAKSAVEA